MTSEEILALINSAECATKEPNASDRITDMDWKIMFSARKNILYLGHDVLQLREKLAIAMESLEDISKFETCSNCLYCPSCGWGLSVPIKSATLALKKIGKTK